MSPMIQPRPITAMMEMMAKKTKEVKSEKGYSNEALMHFYYAFMMTKYYNKMVC